MIEIIKKSALEAVKAEKPCQIMFGTVESNPPIKIRIDQKLVLTEEYLILTKAVTDHYVDIEVNHFTESDPLVGYAPWDTTHGHPDAGSGSIPETHRHGYSGRKKIMIYNGLQKNEKVILIRLQGGQKYIVLDRINDHTVTGEWG